MRHVVNAFTWLLPLLFAFLFCASIAYAVNVAARDSFINTVTRDGSAQTATVIGGQYLGLGIEPEQGPQTPAELAKASAVGGEAPLPSLECRAALAARYVRESFLERACR